MKHSAPIIVMLLLAMILSACGKEEVVTPLPVEESVSAVSTTELPSSYDPEPEPELEPETEPETEPEPESPPTTEPGLKTGIAIGEPISGYSTIVISVVPYGDPRIKPESFLITDDSDKEKIVTYLSQSIGKEPQGPGMGGSLFEITIVNGDKTDFFILVYDSPSDRLVYENREYFVDRELWRTLVKYYPQFDHENNIPLFDVIVNKHDTLIINYSIYPETNIMNDDQSKHAASIYEALKQAKPIEKPSERLSYSGSTYIVRVMDYNETFDHIFIIYKTANAYYVKQVKDFAASLDENSEGSWYSIDAETYGLIGRDFTARGL